MKMSDVEQVDVTTTEDELETSGNLTKCAYCGCQKDGVLAFYCHQCRGWVHASCLHSGPPSSVLGDNYYIFKCTSCSNDGKESFERMKMTWSQVVTLALYNLAQTSLGKQGYFKWKEDICVFIENHWEILFGESKKRKPQWFCTIGSVLSSGNPHHFQSGYGIFKDSGWWRLVDPTQAPEYDPRKAASVLRVHTPRSRGKKSHFGMSSARHNSRKRAHLSLAQQVAENIVKQAKGIGQVQLPSCISNLKDVPEHHMLNRDSCKYGKTSQESVTEENTCVNSSHSSLVSDCNSMPLSPASSYSSDSKGNGKKDVLIDPNLPLLAISDDESDTDNIFHDLMTKDQPFPSKLVTDVNEATSGFVTGRKKDTAASTKTEDRATSNITDLKTQKPQIMMMSLYEEQKLLKKLLSLSGTNDPDNIRRLKRKLLLRRKKRELGLPIFNFDATVQHLYAKENQLDLPVSLINTAAMLPSQGCRILDRFLSMDSRVYSQEECKRTFRQKLIGADDDNSTDGAMLISPYTQRMLKPFIRRDFDTKPPKLKLLEDIVSQHYRNEPDWRPDTVHPIDFCYVRPRHIPTINSMCRHFFWPGVDLSESLQYPDFSVVALYKKMVIGFGFLVPDISFNQAYISFLLVHPDWQRAGIGTFMLYHLIQTCMGKDVTLHVSASNSAMLLYQRFGFKPERFEADFYDKYMRHDTSECTHAFFMRLRR